MIKRLRKKYRMLISIKEAFDNLPVGTAYFDDRGMPVLVNRTMYRLVFSLIHIELQSISELKEILEEPYVFPEDGTVWRFRRKAAANCIEVTATDITELYFRKTELEKANEEQKKLFERMRRISENVVSIARNEEILAMKMYVHNELGYALSAARLFIDSGCRDKNSYVDAQRKIVKVLLGEVGNDDEIDVFEELKASAEKLGMEICIDGKLPEDEKNRILLAAAARECLVNAVRHGGGDTVFIKTSACGGKFTAVMTNNGRLPDKEIKEGGGLSSLRQKLEKNGGSLEIKSRPEFSVTVRLPV